MIKNRRDLRLLLKKRWYRIPAGNFPKRMFSHVAFYQPASFGGSGKRIEYYGRVSGVKTVKRVGLLPEESGHPRAQDDYARISFKGIKKLARPVKNIVPRRITFGFTTLKALVSARNIIQLYGVPPTEQIVEKYLKKSGISALKEYPVSDKGRRYRIDLAVFGNRNKVAVECDNIKAHSGRMQEQKDKIKDSFLNRLGWKVVRLKEHEILERPDRCILKVKQAAGDVFSGSKARN